MNFVLISKYHCSLHPSDAIILVTLATPNFASHRVKFLLNECDSVLNFFGTLWAELFDKTITYISNIMGCYSFIMVATATMPPLLGGFRLSRPSNRKFQNFE